MLIDNKSDSSMHSAMMEPGNGNEMDSGDYDPVSKDVSVSGKYVYSV